MTVFFSAGEASGDAYAAELARGIQALRPDVMLTGIGGRRAREAGVETVIDSSGWGSIGIAQAIRVLPKVLREGKRAQKFLRKGPPGLFIPIDFGFVNTKLARTAKQSGWKVLYFVPPGSWRKTQQGADLPSITDEIVTPFPWSAQILKEMGASAHFFGHPLKQMVAQSSAHERVAGRVAVLPGSRKSELELHLPLLAQTLEPDMQAEFAVAASVDLPRLKATWSRLAPGREDVFTVGDTYGVLKRAEVGYVCSGTATLEAVLCECPCVVFYKVTRLVELQARLFPIRTKFIALPNILQDRLIVPEFVQYEATPERLRTALGELRPGQPKRAAMLAEFNELRNALGPDDAVRQACELAARMLG